MPKVKKKPLPQPPSRAAVLRYPYPRREFYFNDADFASALKRVDERRQKYDLERGLSCL